MGMTEKKRTTAAGDAAKSFEQAVSLTQEQVEKASTAFFRGFDEFATIGKQNLDALVAANTLVAKSFEQIGKEVAVYTQSSLESAASAAKALFGAKTLKDVIAVNNDFAKASFESFVANSTKISEIGVKAANEALQPISAQVNVAIGRLKRPIAA
jgi:phasin family protein